MAAPQWPYTHYLGRPLSRRLRCYAPTHLRTYFTPELEKYYRTAERKVCAPLVPTGPSFNHLQSLRMVETYLS